MDKNFEDLTTEISDGFLEDMFDYRWKEISTYHNLGIRILWLVQQGYAEEEVINAISVKTKRVAKTIRQFIAFVRKYPTLDSFDKSITWLKIAGELEQEETKKKLTVKRIKEILDGRFKENANAGLDERALEDESVINIIKEENTNDMGRT